MRPGLPTRATIKSSVEMEKGGLLLHHTSKGVSAREGRRVLATPMEEERRRRRKSGIKN